MRETEFLPVAVTEEWRHDGLWRVWHEFVCYSGIRRCQVNKQKGDGTVPVKWSSLKMSEAMDMVEEFLHQADEPLEQAKMVVTEARNIVNLPKYLNRSLIHLIGDIERINHVKGAIKSVRSSLPDGALDAERMSAKINSQATLIV